ncbi:MAG: hypothetical protein U5L00_03265 [Desulfovermiculus sp.]|nr:hypothetical protein [Desulfovermiculus sp.]
MADRYRELTEQLRELEEKIEEQKKRIPPHSVKPEQIMELERLEEERDDLQAKLRSLKNG